MLGKHNTSGSSSPDSARDSEKMSTGALRDNQQQSTATMEDNQPLVSRTGATSGIPQHHSHGAARGNQHYVDSQLYVMPKRTPMDWVALAVMMVAAIAVFFINLTASGYANDFYAAAAQAGSENWTAFLFGSLDMSNAITVDKPPAALWLMAISVKIFGLNSFAILLPEALLGIATTYMLYATVRRYWGNRAGIATGFVFMLTPVAALMFRFNNPDALLVFLMTAAAYAIMRSLEYSASREGNRKRTWWMVLAGVCIGFGFLTKQMQVFLVVPAFVLTFLVASPTKFLRRLVDGIAAVMAIVVSAGWWIALTVLVPADQRPYIGGSQTNSFLELTFGYNGLGRLTGSETGSVVPSGRGGNSESSSASSALESAASAATSSSSSNSHGGGGNSGGMWGSTGLSRLFDGTFSTQISWLAPIAFVGIIIGLVAVGHAARIDLRRASILLFGGWLVFTWLTFSFMAGIVHQYYTVALSPALAVMVVIACTSLWLKRRSLWAQIVAPLLMLGNTVWAYVLIGRASWMPWLKWAVLVVGVIASIIIALAGLMSSKIIAIIGSTLTAIALMAGPLSWTAYTVGTAHTGSLPTAGPSVSGGQGGGMGGNGGGQGGPGSNFSSEGSMGMPGGSSSSSSDEISSGSASNGDGSTTTNGQGGTGQGSAGQGSMGQGSMQGGPGGQSGTGNGGSSSGSNSSSNSSKNSGSGSSSNTGSQGGNGGGARGGTGQTSAQVIALLKESDDSYAWAAATVGAHNAAAYQLASDKAIMAIGGYNGTDPYPTLAQFKEYVKSGKIHYYIAGSTTNGKQQNGGSSVSSKIATWVAANYTAITVDGTTYYDLSQSAN